jgi:hypothetical protein
VSAEPAPLRRLVAVDSDTGEAVSAEVAALQARLASAEETIKDLEKDLRVKRAQLTKRNKDLIKERLEYGRRDDVKRIHSYWQRKLGNSKALTADRFDAVKGMLEERRYEIVDGKAKKIPAFRWPEDFKLAVDGAAFDPMTKPMRNGKVQKFDDLELIFRDGSHMQSFIDRAPSA